jgi:hypothetical protein
MEVVRMGVKLLKNKEMKAILGCESKLRCTGSG